MGINPKETKPVTGQDLCTHMFTAPLFTLVKTWKQPKCPSMDEYIKINTYTHNGIYKKWDIIQLQNRRNSRYLWQLG